MCDERERLIEYVYGETGVAARRQLDAHLAECSGCRAEVAGLRAVRDDLLAWEVPRHEAIWRPFAAAPARPARSRWSAWALAAAAGAVFTAGMAGGMAARGWRGDAAPAASTVAAVQPAPALRQTTSVAVTPDDLARLEAGILERVRAEMAEQLRQAPASAVPVRANVGRGGDAERRLAAVEAWITNQEAFVDDQIRLNNIFNAKMSSLSSRISNQSEQFDLSRFQRVGLDGGVR